ncbi:MAG: BMP family ABC transporter substrate-binding protein [Solobacterium sp.]|nr:BMP family ABC transporter substrate-binding protein [Solobacterium sp.]
MEEYSKARKAGMKAYRQAEDTGQNPYPAVLDNLIDTASLKAIDIGVTSIPADQIIGTKTAGRQNAFACNFMPLLDPESEFGRKWQALYDSQVEEGIRDPILVYEYLHRFYVQEGNKRVSVLNYLEMPVIQADVKRFMPTEPDKLYDAFLKFYKVCPLYELDFSEPASYLKFAELLGQDLEHPWPEKLCMHVNTAFYSFRKEYLRSSERISNISDAFLTFVSMYGLDELRRQTGTVIRQKISAIRSEMQVRSSGDNIVVKENPQEKKGGSLLSDLTKIIPQYTVSKPLRLSFVYDSTPENSAWNYDHEVGRIYLKQKFGGLVRTEFYENRKDGQLLREALEQAAKNSDAVFTVSPLQVNETMKAAVRHPNVHFLSCSLYLPAKAVRAYYVRMYEIKFLLGALAAMMSDNHRICYIADYPIYGTVANINAFAIGASLVDPRSQIILGWSGVNDQDWQKELQYLGVDIFSGPDLAQLSQDSTVFGLCQLEQDGKIRNLAMPVINWAKYYEKLVQTMLDGEWDNEDAGKYKAVNYWWGIEAGAADIVVSSSVPYSSAKMIELMKDALKAGRLSPFSHELRSQSGIIQNANSGRLSIEQIIRMDWLNDNVIGVIPAYGKLSEEAKELTRVAGIDTVRGTR